MTGHPRAPPRRLGRGRTSAVTMRVRSVASTGVNVKIKWAGEPTGEGCPLKAPHGPP